MDIAYLVSREEIRRYGHLARKIRATHPPHTLAKSFVDVVNPGAMAQPNGAMGKRGQEEWMDEDDLLGGELGKEQDLRFQLQKGGRGQMEPY